MNIDFLRRIALIIVLCLAQVLILNRIHLLGCATPLLYVYIVGTFPCNHPRWSMLLWCFITGLVVDIFSNTPGVAACSMTLAAMIRPLILTPFIPRDSDEAMVPGIRTMGVGAFLNYTILTTVIYSLVFFALEIFSVAGWLQWLKCFGGSTVLTVVFILAVESLRRK